MDDTGVDLDLARKILTEEGQAITSLSRRIDENFARAARMLYNCAGKVVLTGIGKAGIIAQKISATLASTGTQSIFLHPVEALHGDLGRLQRSDVVIALSNSGQTAEILRLVDHLKSRGAGLVVLTSSADSPLAKAADVAICYGDVEEACPLGLAPTVSTTCMLALGDALSLTVMRMRKFTPEDFAAFHPAGALGRKLLKVEEAMLFGREQASIVSDRLSLKDALAQAEKVPRRAGAMLLVDAKGRLSGILTDADLRRALLKGGNDIMAKPVSDLMTRNPKHIHLGELASEAMALCNKHRLDEMPVLDEADKPVGIIDVQDLLGIKTVNDVRE